MITTKTPLQDSQPGLFYDPYLIDKGWLAQAKKTPSPNFNPRPEGGDISLLVIHNISLPPEQFGDSYIEDFFCNRLKTSRHPYFAKLVGLQVSAHLLITRKGEILQFVSFNDRAWHAGQSEFEGRSNCNDFSIGIELEGSDHIPYTAIQYRQLVRVTKALMRAYPRLTENPVVGHSQIAPGRKTDPGPAFRWENFNRLMAQ